MLACDCDYGDDVEWWHGGPREPATLATKRMRRCCSCNVRIAVGDECAAVHRWRTPEEGSVAHRIYCDEEPLPTWYLCERCLGLHESLAGLGFCNLIGQDLRAVCREYAQMQRDALVFRGQIVVSKNTPNSM